MQPPPLGLAVLYCVQGAAVPREQLLNMLAEAQLDIAVSQLPRRADAFALAVNDAKATYPQPWLGPKLTASVYVRKVETSSDKNTYAMVRETRDRRRKGGVTSETVADIVFLKRRRGGDPTPYQGGKPEIRLRREVVHDRERDILHEVTAQLRQRYYDLCMSLNSDRIRALVRDYLTNQLHAVRLKPSGGNYFVLPEYADQVRRLAGVVNQLGGQCAMDVIALGDHPEYRRMVQRGIGLEISQDLAEMVKDAQRRQPRNRPKLWIPFEVMVGRCEEYIGRGFELPEQITDAMEELIELLHPEETAVG